MKKLNLYKLSKGSQEVLKRIKGALKEENLFNLFKGESTFNKGRRDLFKKISNLVMVPTVASLLTACGGNSLEEETNATKENNNNVIENIPPSIGLKLYSNGEKIDLKEIDDKKIGYLQEGDLLQIEIKGEDKDGTVEKIRIYINDKKVKEINGDTYTFEKDNLNEDFKFKVEVEDDKGEISSDEFQVQVEYFNEAPIITEVSVDKSEIKDSETIILTADVYDPDGNEPKVIWYEKNGDEDVEVGKGNKLILEPRAGVHIYYAVAIDEQGAETKSDTVEVNVEYNASWQEFDYLNKFNDTETKTIVDDLSKYVDHLPEGSTFEIVDIKRTLPTEKTYEEIKSNDRLRGYYIVLDGNKLLRGYRGSNDDDETYIITLGIRYPDDSEGPTKELEIIIHNN